MKDKNRLPFYLAFKYIQRGRKWTLTLTVFLVAIAFVNLIFISSLFNGIIEGTNAQIINTLTGNIYLAPQEGEKTIPDKTEVIKKLKTIKEITGVSAQLQVPGRLEYNKISGNWSIVAIQPSDESTVTNIHQKMIAGEYLKDDDEDGIIIGQQIAGGQNVEQNAFSFKGAQVGDRVKILIGEQEKEFTIRGIFKTKFINADEKAFITQAAFNRIIPELENQANTLIVKIKSDDDKDKVISKIEKQAISGNIYTWEEVSGLMKSVSESFLSINAIMIFVGILIASATIFIVIYIDIINKRRQIGILRAIGIQPYIIISSYVILSAIYSILGIVLGTIIFFAILVPYFIAHPFQIPLADVVLELDQVDSIARAQIVMIVSVISGLIPAVIVTKAKMLNTILGK